MSEDASTTPFDITPHSATLRFPDGQSITVPIESLIQLKLELNTFFPVDIRNRAAEKAKNHSIVMYHGSRSYLFGEVRLDDEVKGA